MNSLKVLLFVLSLWVTVNLPAQTISKSVIGSSGITQTSDHLRLSWSLGETVVGTMTAGGQQLGNGFFASLDNSLLAVPESVELPLTEVFPNPATRFLICRQRDSHQMHITVTGIDGKVIIDENIASGDKTNVQSWQHGMYLITLTDQVTMQKSLFKILRSGN